MVSFAALGCGDLRGIFIARAKHGRAGLKLGTLRDQHRAGVDSENALIDANRWYLFPADVFEKDST